jgi:hypothetical protein
MEVGSVFRRAHVVCRWAIATLVAGVALSWTASASAQIPLAPHSSSGDCRGLACVVTGQRLAVPEATSSPVARIGGPEQLRSQTRPGFYEYAWRDLAAPVTAYVAPPGRIDEAPASVQALPIVGALRESRGAETGTLIVFGPDAASIEPSVTFATPVASASRASARIALGYSDCPAGYFCLWDFDNYGGAMFAIGYTAGIWYDLGPDGWGNRANANRVRRSTDALLSLYNAGVAPRRCFDSYTATASLGSFSNDTSSVFVSSSDGRC